MMQSFRPGYMKLNRRRRHNSSSIEAAESWAIAHLFNIIVTGVVIETSEYVEVVIT